MRFAGQYAGLANVRVCAGGGGRRCRFKESNGASRDCFLRAKGVPGGPAGSNLMRGSARALAAANEDQFAGDGGIAKGDDVDAKWP